jgi:hypothetical protein
MITPCAFARHQTDDISRSLACTEAFPADAADARMRVRLASTRAGKFF